MTNEKLEQSTAIKKEIEALEKFIHHLIRYNRLIIFKKKKRYNMLLESLSCSNFYNLEYRPSQSTTNEIVNILMTELRDLKNEYQNL